MENYNAHELMREYAKAAHGAAAISAIKKAIRQADLVKDIEYQLWFRNDLIKESVFYGDKMDAMITFPQLLALDEQNPGQIEPYYLCCCFKWIIEDAQFFPQITKEEIESYFEAFKKTCQKHGYSLRSYYQKFRNVYMDIDENRAKEANWKMQMCKRDSLSDCEACELDEQVGFDLLTGQTGKAFEEMKPILNHELSCAEVPGLTYDRLMVYYCWQNDRKNAKKYFELLYQMIFKADVCSMTGYYTIGNMLSYCSMYDRAQGIELYQKSAGTKQNNHNPFYQMQFAKGAYRLFLELQKEREFLNVSLPVAEVEKTKEGYPLSALSEFYYREYMELAKRFDERNQNSKYMDELQSGMSQIHLF